MKKSYSSLNVLNNKMTANYKGLFHTIFSAKKYLTIKLPYYQYLRGNIFIEDIKDNYIEDIPFSFDMAHFVLMLYSDFMQQIKKGVKNEDVATYLKNSINKYFPITYVEKRVFNQVSNTLFQYEQVIKEVPEEDNEKYAYLEIRVREKIVLRGEVLLHDLSPYLGDIQITVEQLFTIIYLDFIKNVRENGNSIAIQETIVSKLRKDD